MKLTYILAASLLIAACNNKKHTTETDEATETPKIEVTDTTSTATVQEVDGMSGATNVTKEPSFNGIFVVPSQRKATVTLTMGGIIRNTSLMVGQYVKKGTVIATLDNPEFIDLQQNFLDAAARLEYLQKEYIRQKNLAKEEAASQKQFQSTKADYLSGKTKYEGLKAQLSLLGINASRLKAGDIMTRLRITAPISGYVTNTNVNVGKYLNAGEPVCDIIDKSHLLLQLTAYEKDLSKLKVGSEMEFTVNGMPGKVFNAILYSIDQKVDTENRSIKVYAKLKESNSIFRPGMYVSAKIKENH